MRFEKRFMDSLGSYIYVYSSEGDVRKALLEGTGVYAGKGVETRTLAHTKTEEKGGKGYSEDDIFIIMRNGEQFADNTKPAEIASFSGESLLIALSNPKDNKVSGRNSDLFVFEHLTVLYDKWKQEQINPVAEEKKFWASHPELEQVTQATTTNSSGTVYQTKRLDGTEYNLHINYTTAGPEATLKVNFSKKGVGGKTMEELFELWQEEYPELETTPAAAVGEYIIADFGSTEDTLDFFIEAAQNEYQSN